MKNLPHLLYHIVVIVLGAAIAFSLPSTASFLAGKFLAFWAYVENEKLFLVSLEVTAGTLFGSELGQDSGEFLAAMHDVAVFVAVCEPAAGGGTGMRAERPTSTPPKNATPAAIVALATGVIPMFRQVLDSLQSEAGRSVLDPCNPIE